MKKGWTARLIEVHMSYKKKERNEKYNKNKQEGIMDL